MPIDVEKVLAAEFPKLEFEWNEDRVILYHLGLGAGADFTNKDELTYTYERDLKVLPTFATLPVHNSAPKAVRTPGFDVDLRKVVHGEHEIQVEKPIPVTGKVVTESGISGVWDRGTGAVLEVSNKTFDADTGDLLFTNIWSLFARGAGDFGGERGPNHDVDLPDREPDHSAEFTTLPQIAQIYRMSGDKTPMHIDPDFAAKAGFDRPFVQGLCTMGMVCKAIVDEMLGGDVSLVARYRVRFAKPVFPGDTIRVMFWREGNKIIAIAENLHQNTPIVTNVILETRA